MILIRLLGPSLDFLLPYIYNYKAVFSYVTFSSKVFLTSTWQRNTGKEKLPTSRATLSAEHIWYNNSKGDHTNCRIPKMCFLGAKQNPTLIYKKVPEGPTMPSQNTTPLVPGKQSNFLAWSHWLFWEFFGSQSQIWHPFPLARSQ